MHVRVQVLRVDLNPVCMVWLGGAGGHGRGGGCGGDSWCPCMGWCGCLCADGSMTLRVWGCACTVQLMAQEVVGEACEGEGYRWMIDSAIPCMCTC